MPKPAAAASKLSQTTRARPFKEAAAATLADADVQSRLLQLGWRFPCAGLRRRKSSARSCKPTPVADHQGVDWQAAVMQFSVGEGLRRAVKNRLRSGNEGSEADLDWRAQELAGSMRPYVNNHAIEAEMYLSRRSEMDSIHKRQLSAQRRRDSSLRQLEQRRSRQHKEAAQIGRALIDERNREEFAAPEMVTIARKNGARDVPELKTAGSEPLRKSQNGHG
jgi:hypothetical protein